MKKCCLLMPQRRFGILANSQRLSLDDFAVISQFLQADNNAHPSHLLEPNSASVTSVRSRRNTTDISLTLSRFSAGQFQEQISILRVHHAPHRCTQQSYFYSPCCATFQKALCVHSSLMAHHLQLLLCHLLPLKVSALVMHLPCVSGQSSSMSIFLLHFCLELVIYVLLIQILSLKTVCCPTAGCSGAVIFGEGSAVFCITKNDSL